MTLARLRVLLAGAELDLREMGVRDPDYAEIRLVVDYDVLPERVRIGDEVGLVAIEARVDSGRRATNPHVLLSATELWPA